MATETNTLRVASRSVMTITRTENMFPTGPVLDHLLLPLTAFSSQGIPIRLNPSPGCIFYRAFASVTPQWWTFSSIDDTILSYHSSHMPISINTYLTERLEQVLDFFFYYYYFLDPFATSFATPPWCCCQR